MATTKQNRTPESGQRYNTAPASWLKRTGWLILIWVLSVSALGLAAMVMRMIMNAAGLGR